jgi:polar amino acid transport system permease protein
VTGGDFETLLMGAWTTIWLSAVSIAVGIPLGLVLGLGRVARVPVLSHLIALYVSIGRATPLVTLVLLLFVGLPAVGLDIGKITAGILTLVLNTATFNAEIWRSVYQAFPAGQVEAARAVGMTRSKCFLRIMLPQMSVSALPGLMNEATMLVKASPAIAVIGIVDLTRVSDRIAAQTYEPMPPILVACALYIAINSGLVRLQRIVERRAARYAS